MNIKGKNLIALISLIIFSLIIWFVGPLLMIGNQYILQQPEKRFYIIALFFVVWMLYLFIKQENHIFSSIPSEFQNKMQILQERFKGAIHFLKKTSLNNKNSSHTNLSHLPWYLLIGPNDAGKTTLLANANINYILTKQFKQEKIGFSDSCDWWVARDLVLVDIPGSYLKEKNNYLWDAFIGLIKKNCHRETLRAVVITFPFAEYIKQPALQQKNQLRIEEIKQKILLLQQAFSSQVAFFIIATKCDQLTGFQDFFADCSTEELSQAWGITIPFRKTNENLYEIFNDRFNALIKRLNNQLIWRLHQERNANSRPAIKDFPLQIERLKESISLFLKSLDLPKLNLQGVYLTSAFQNGTEDLSNQSQIINPNANQVVQLLRIPPLPSKPFFVRQCLLHGLLSLQGNTTENTTAPKKPWRKQLTYVTAIIVISMAALLLGHDFQQGVLQVYSIQNNLAQYQLSIQQSAQDGDQLIRALPLLNTLQAAATRKIYNVSHFDNLLSFYSDKSQKTASKVYQQALQTIVLPAVKNTFEIYLKNAGDKDPVQIYAVLKAYLMLSDPSHLDVSYIGTTLKQIMTNDLFQKQTLNELISHINPAMQYSSKSLVLSQELITQIRGKLKALSIQDLAFVILKNMNNNNAGSTISLVTQNPSTVFSSKQISEQIPILFTAEKFGSIYSQDILDAARASLTGDWVIGNGQSNDSGIDVLAQQLRARYVANYVDLWESLLDNLNLIDLTSLDKTNAVITTLTSDSSPLLQLLQTFKVNTSFAPILSASPNIHSLNTLLSSARTDQENPLYQIFVTLKELNTYLNDILNSNDIGYAAFSVAENRMQSPVGDPITQIVFLAERIPDPVKGWLNTLASKSWYFILKETSQYIENAWQLNIAPVYRAEFASRFPFDPDGHEEVDLQQFVSFVQKQGTFAMFYQRYLKGFINDDGKKWEWRIVDNQKLPFSNSALEQIEQTSRLQNLSKYTLFSQGHTNPAIQNFKLPKNLIDKG